MRRVLWFRRDLRLHDLPALRNAAEDADVLGLFVIDPVLWDRCGPARRAWLAANLRALSTTMQGRLVIGYDDPATCLVSYAQAVGAASVHVTGETTPYGIGRDRRVEQALERAGIGWQATDTSYAVAPGTIRSGKGTPYRVFTPFARTWRQHGWPAPSGRPASIRWLQAESAPQAEALIEEAIAHGPVGMPEPGEAAAVRRWRRFRDESLTDYDTARDRPDLDATSRMSAYLKLGVVHPRQLLADLAAHPGPGAAAYETELGWREFYADVVWHHPESRWADLTPLPGMAYDEAPAAVVAWQQGRTGFPIVDAGMRQLLHEGWMHNRVRMIVASFFAKDLHLWWPAGARYFLDRLIDGDIASNNHGWQWVAGTGTDAAPYFRVFNPTTQGKKFDAQGDYVRRWIPELRHLAGAAAHEPWRQANGYANGYPPPIADHAAERLEALRRYQAR